MTHQPNSETLARLDQLLGDPTGRRVGVLGLGVVGAAMARNLAKRGAHVVAADQRASLRDQPIASVVSELRLGEMDQNTFNDVEGLAISPGAHPGQPAVAALTKRGVPVFGELELCGALPAKVAAITGTNGKSTTTALLGEMVAATGAKTFVGGNLGDSILTWLDTGGAADVAVLELSSFQLETAYRFTPDVTVMLNITPDHTDRYADLEDYAKTKERAVEQLSPDGVAVLNHDDERVRAMAEHAPGRVWWFSTASGEVPGDGVGLRGDVAVPHGALAPLGEISLEHERLLGRHNRENALAAWLAAHALGSTAQPTDVMRGYQNFRGLPHRMEHVRTVGGVTWINDSKATNDEAATTALRSLPGPVVLLLGGRDKGAGYNGVLSASRGVVKEVIAFGEAAALINKALGEQLPAKVVPTMTAAMQLARARATRGDTVLLSPACSSFDEFENYQVRGDTFRRWVDALEDSP